ncbi:YraN family protein [Candidatus Babeliales bacterium]|nr:YraN family protein [Candidatus Babeliales bacterium]
MISKVDTSCNVLLDPGSKPGVTNKKNKVPHLTKQRKLGNTGEKLAAAYLKSEGFKICAVNFSTKLGEIDIIAQKYDFISFIEVKTRKKEHFAVSQVVTKSKQQKIIKTAKLYTMRHKIKNKVLRFDIITVIGSQDDHKINHIKNAFYGQ